MLSSVNSNNPKPPVATRISILCLALMMLCGGCGSKHGTLFSVSDESIVWPAAPERPRIKYGGQLTSELIARQILPALGSEYSTDKLTDAALLQFADASVAFTTDSL